MVPKKVVAGHWDGFQVSGKKQRGCWVMETNVLNAGRSSSLSLLPVLFIPLSGNHPYVSERMRKNIIAFTRPFIEELETLFVDGMECRYNYPTLRISNLLPRSETLNVRAVLMLLTGNHPAQCKISNMNPLENRLVEDVRCIRSWLMVGTFMEIMKINLPTPR